MRAAEPVARAARDVAVERASIAAAEIAAIAAIAVVSGVATLGALAAPLAIACAVALARTAAGAATIARQDALHRAASAPDDERFVPSARVLELARRAPPAVAWSAPVLAVPVLAAAGVGAAPALLVVAMGIAAAPAIEARVRAPIDHWIARIPPEELPDRPPVWDALAHAGLAAAPALAVALVALAIAPGPLALLALAPAALLAGRAWQEVGRARQDLAKVARAIAATLPGAELEVSGIASDAADRLRGDAVGILRVAGDAVRAATDAQSAIEREEQVRARFTAAMGHELRSPLNSIVGFAQLLEDGADGPISDAQRESVVLIRRSAEDLLRLLTDILDSARLDAGRLRLKKAWTPSVEIVTEAVREGRRVAEGMPITIEAHVQPGLPPVNVDRARVVQAVVATFRHAVRSTGRAKLELRAAVGQDPRRMRALLVEVRDPERTLSRDELERIFDAFRDLRDAQSGRRHSGLGLALSLARKLVRLHGGEVWAESSAQNGTRWVVALPLDEKR